MSIMVTLTSLIALGISLSTTTALQIADVCSDKNSSGRKAFPTIFHDVDLLEKTLTEHGCQVKKISDLEFTVNTSCGGFRYFRKELKEPFQLELGQIHNPEVLIAELRGFETEYGRNVQTYTYNHIKENLKEDMTIVAEEVLEDDSLLLTINV